MADKVYDIGIGTKVDNSGLEKGLSEAEREILKSTAKQSEAIEKAAQEQVEAVRKTEAEKIEEIKRSIEEQIQIEKSKGLDPSTLQAEINAIKERENSKIKEVKTAANLEVQVIQDAAKKKQKAEQDGAKKRIETVRNANKTALQSIKDYAKSATQSLSGMDFSKLLVPTAIVGASIAALTKLKGALDNAAASYRVQEQAEVTLANAARNNPYLNDRNVKQLSAFANEMQRISGLDSALIMQTQTRLASLGRNQQQIQQIITVATDMAASGVMTFDQAIEELNNSLNGMVRTSGRMYPELKNLSAEALASGRAIEIMGQKVAGSAEAAMRTGAGTVTAYKNALGNLQRSFGQDWEQATRGFRVAITNFINNIVEARNASREFKRVMEAMAAGSATASDALTVQETAIRNLNNELDILIRYRDRAAMSSADRQTAQFLRQQGKSVESVQEEIRLQEQLIDISRQRVELNSAMERIQRSAVEGTGSLANATDLLRRAEVELNNGRTANARSYLNSLNEIANNLEVQAQATETQRQNEESAEQFRLKNQEALDEEMRKMVANAELRGEIDRREADRLRAAIRDRAENEVIVTDNLALQRQLLDANSQAYFNLLEAAKEVIDGTDQAERDRFERLRSNWAELDRRANQERITDQERADRIRELGRLQKEVQSNVTRIYEEANREAARLYDTAREQEYQDELLEIRERSLTEAVEFEIRERRRANSEQYQGQLEALDRNYQLTTARSDELRRAELDAAGNNAYEREQIERRFNDSRLELERNYQIASGQLAANQIEQERLIEIDRVKMMEEANKKIVENQMKMYQELLSEIQKYINAASQLADSISAIWTNIIDRETDEQLRKNKLMIQSDEERAAEEKRILAKAAQERYKAEMAAWVMNVTMATAQAAMAILNALAQPPGPPTTIPMSILAGIMGAAQVATIISAQPKRPTFHDGGIVPGKAGRETNITALGQEVFMNQRQFQNQMRVTSQLADMKTGNQGISMNVKVINNAANDVATSQNITESGLEIIVTGIVDKQLSKGSLDSALGRQQTQYKGTVLY